MTPPAMHVVRRGAGEPLLFLHAGAGSHLQWLPLFHRLSREYLCVAPDLLGHGASVGEGDEGELFGAEHPDEVVPAQVAALRELIDEQDAPVHLVGHSYGGVMALMTTLADRARVASLLVIEPPLFQLLRQAGDDALYDEAAGVEAACIEAISLGEALRAAELFVSYWSGRELWEAMPEVFRTMLAHAAPVRDRIGTAAMFGCTLPDDAGARLVGLPVTVLSGGRSPAPARGIARRLVERLPGARLVVVEEAGHMLPQTHGRRFLEVLQQHLRG